MSGIQIQFNPLGNVQMRSYRYASSGIYSKSWLGIAVLPIKIYQNVCIEIIRYARSNLTACDMMWTWRTCKIWQTDAKDSWENAIPDSQRLRMAKIGRRWDLQKSSLQWWAFTAILRKSVCQSHQWADHYHDWLPICNFTWSY